MSWFRAVPYTSTVNETTLRNLYTPLVDQLKAVGLIDPADNGTLTGSYLRYRTTKVNGNYQVHIRFGLVTISSTVVQTIQLELGNGVSTTTANVGGTSITQQTQYLDTENKLLILSSHSNSSGYTTPVALYWESEAKDIGNGVLAGPLYLGSLVHGGLLSSLFTKNGTTAVVNIVYGSFYIPALSLVGTNTIADNEVGITIPLRSGIIVVPPGYKEVKELPNRLLFAYAVNRITDLEPIPEYYNINGGGASGKWVLLGG